MIDMKAEESERMAAAVKLHPLSIRSPQAPPFNAATAPGPRLDRKELLAMPKFALQYPFFISCSA